MISSFLTFLLFFLSLVFLPLKPLQFEPVKVIFSETIIGILLIIFILKNKVVNLKIDKNLLFLCLGVLLLSIFDLIFLRTPISFWGNTFRLQGIFLLWNLIILTILSSLIPIKKVAAGWIIMLLFIELAASCFMGLTPDGRIVGTLGEPNALASYIVFLFPFILFNEKANKFLKLAGFILAFFALALAGSRSGGVAFLIEFIAFLLYKVKKLNIKQIVIFLSFLTVLSLSLPFLEKPASLLENRQEIWRVGFLAGLKSPIYGTGFGNIEYAIRNEARKINSPIQYVYIDSGHNIILDWFIESGLIGVVLFFAIIYFTITNFIKRNNISYLIAFLGLFTTLLFNPASVVGLIELFGIFGMSFIKY